MASLIKVSLNEVNLFINNNNVSELDFDDIKLYSFNNEKQEKDYNSTASIGSTVLHLQNNPIRCDCDNFDLIQYNNDKLDPVIRVLVDIRMEDVYCAMPVSFQHILVKDLKPRHITCPIYEGCPQECECASRPFDNHNVVYCASRNLTSIPVINFHRNKKVEVNLADNSLEIAPYKGLGYENVTKLYLSNNRIKNISWIPPQLEVNHTQIHLRMLVIRGVSFTDVGILK